MAAPHPGTSPPQHLKGMEPLLPCTGGEVVSHNADPAITSGLLSSVSVHEKDCARPHPGCVTPSNIGTLFLHISPSPAMGSIPAVGSTGTAFLGCVFLTELGCGQELCKSQFVSNHARCLRGLKWAGCWSYIFLFLAGRKPNQALDMLPAALEHVRMPQTKMKHFVPQPLIHQCFLPTQRPANRWVL